MELEEGEEVPGTAEVDEGEDIETEELITTERGRRRGGWRRLDRSVIVHGGADGGDQLRTEEQQRTMLEEGLKQFGGREKTKLNQLDETGRHHSAIVAATVLLQSA